MSLVLFTRYKEKGNIEAHFFSIQTNLKAQGLRYFVPPEGKTVSDIERAWNFLEKAEHDRELALREEMIRCGLTQSNCCRKRSLCVGGVVYVYSRFCH